jgi:excisionase family DNA binding protein
MPTPSKRPPKRNRSARAISEHVEINGLRLRFPEPERAARQFLRKLEALATDAKASAADVRALAFGPENPVLAKHPTLGGAYVDADCIRNPVYWVCVDLVMRAEARAAGITPALASAPFTTTVTEAAKRLGVYQHAVQHAVAGHSLHAWMLDGRCYLLPDEVARYGVRKRNRSKKKAKR